MVRAKFRCVKNEREEDKRYGELAFEAVVGGSEENDSFFSATPSGHLSMGVVSEQTAARFEIGKEYYLDFTEAS